jgi:hypothetical protein
MGSYSANLLLFLTLAVGYNTILDNPSYSSQLSLPEKSQEKTAQKKRGCDTLYEFVQASTHNPIRDEDGNWYTASIRHGTLSLNTNADEEIFLTRPDDPCKIAKYSKYELFKAKEQIISPTESEHPKLYERFRAIISLHLKSIESR